MSLNKKIVILAGNYREFINFLSEKERLDINGCKKYIYCDHPAKVYGIKIADIEIIGTFWERKDAGKLYESAKCRLDNLY